TAIAAGVVDYVLSPQQIALELARLAHHPYLAPKTPDKDELSEEPFTEFLKLLLAATGVDFAQYKHPTIQRRMMRRMAVHRIEFPEEYIDFLNQHPEELQALYNDLLINVTEFFRDPRMFEALRKVAFPQILKDRA